MKNRLQRYDIKRPMPRQGPSYTKSKMYFSVMMLICIKQHVSNIWRSIHESNTDAQLKKSVAYRKKCV